MMSDILHFPNNLLQRWIAIRHERRLLLDILEKPDDRLLRDAGITREEAALLLKSLHGAPLRTLPPRRFTCIASGNNAH